MQNSTYEGCFFGNLLVRLDLGMVYNASKNNKYRKVLAECLNCSSGVKSYILDPLKSSKTKSCGCLHKDLLRKKLTKHGGSNTETYKTWEAMKHRCGNPNNHAYKNYGERGITVCDRWLNSFENFLKDMGERPEGTQIDRIDNNKGYSPENCRWATRSMNTFNQRKKKSNSSGRSGVYFHKQTKKWSAEIHKKGKKHYLGIFERFEEAVRAREEAEINFFGFTKD